MNKLFLIIGKEQVAIVNCHELEDIDLSKIKDILGQYIEIYEIGLANPKTPPGCILVGDKTNLSPYSPLGNRLL